MSNTEIQRVGAEALVARVAFYAGAAKAENTQRSYASDMKKFTTWAAKNSVPSLPTSAEVLACYVASLADEGKKVSTIERAVAGIMSAHRRAGLDMPRGRALEEAMAGIRRTLGTAKIGKEPILASDLRKMVDATASLRDRAILLIGWVGAFRRSEIASLRVEDVKETRHGLEVTVRKSKTDQAGAGRVVGLPNSMDAALCPVRALTAWLSSSGIASGPIFPFSDKAVARVVESAAHRVGLKGVSAHSLRSGFMTEAAAQNRSLKSMMGQTGHRSERIAMSYVRHNEVWSDNAARGLL